MPPGVRQQILERDGRACQYCSGTAHTVSLLVPAKYGGTKVPENMVAACRACASAKSDLLPVRHVLAMTHHIQAGHTVSNGYPPLIDQLYKDDYPILDWRAMRGAKNLLRPLTHDEVDRILTRLMSERWVRRAMRRSKMVKHVKRSFGLPDQANAEMVFEILERYQVITRNLEQTRVAISVPQLLKVREHLVDDLTAALRLA